MIVKLRYYTLSIVVSLRLIRLDCIRCLLLCILSLLLECDLLLSKRFGIGRKVGLEYADQFIGHEAGNDRPVVVTSEG